MYHLQPSFCHKTIDALIHFAVGFCGLGAGRFYGLYSAVIVVGLKEKSKPSILMHILKLIMEDLQKC